MNYIRHLNTVFQQFSKDSRLNPTHVSLYMALFQYWNINRFPEEFYINREEVMAMAKIGSKATYHRCLRRLDEWKYLQYMPSHNPFKGSKIRLLKFCTTNGTTTGTSNEQVVEQALVPNINYNKQIKTENKRSKERQPKNEDVVIKFFKKNKWPIMEGPKFYNHYQGVGWKVGRKSTIEDWKAMAKKWMLRAMESDQEGAFLGRSNKKHKTDFLDITINKNYEEPL
ncbi:hypothetical protein [Arenibacter sp. S6351L]|uniref:hypothetical protein n=1 Tax=Arenibacter sp. S6351L TaxID=2926407 RepID=UPI001FF20044|nr:hypothetical protein [Arenibacter sp. S6351L]MCK0135889.1 hypothetical protein [Arenibacter sp. S6351L]